MNFKLARATIREYLKFRQILHDEYMINEGSYRDNQTESIELFKVYKSSLKDGEK